MATQYQLNNLQELYDAKKITESEYEKRKKEILNQDARRQHDNAVIQAGTQAALGVLYAMQGDPYTLAARVAVAAAIGLAQTAIVAAQPIPQYAEGTDFVKLGRNKKGKDTIHAMLNEGEAVIKTEQNAAYPGLAKAWNDGKLDEHIYKKWVLPEIIMNKSMDGLKEKSFAENIAKSIQLNQDFGGLENRLKRLEQAEREGAVFIGESIKDALNNNLRKGY